jgi:hypothetical protein
MHFGLIYDVGGNTIYKHNTRKQIECTMPTSPASSLEDDLYSKSEKRDGDTSISNSIYS